MTQQDRDTVQPDNRIAIVGRSGRFPAARDVAVDDVDSCSGVQLGVLETFGRIELAVRRSRIV